MKTYRLDGVQHINPLWFNSVRSGMFDAVVEESGIVVLKNEPMTLREAELPTGTAVRVWLNSSGFFVCATVEEFRREQAEREAAEAAQAEQTRQRLNARRAEAQAFNAKLKLPVRWDVAIKDVLSGLSVNSWGDGRSKSTVEHIYLLEALRSGRLMRKEGDFLCTAASGSNGKQWSGVTLESAVDGDGSHYQPKVTCKACLSLAKRWIVDAEANAN